MVKKQISHNQEIGRKGERIALEHLIAQGYVLIKKNYYTRDGEIDIICTNGETLLFAEVKTRSGLHSGYPEEAVSAAKIVRATKAIEKFLIDYVPKEKNIRYDVVAIYINKNNRVQLKQFAII